MESSQCLIAFKHKTVAGGKDIQVACTTCTFLNAGDVSLCGMCGMEIKPPTHDVQADGSWKCGSCEVENQRGAKKCTQCRLSFYSLVTTAAPAQIFCSRCGFLNDGGNLKCVQCDYTIRSTLEKISTDLKDSTNFLARDMGVNIHVKCPGCLVVCYVPPATACLRCGSCHTYFASPSVGEVTSFHMNRLASSISNSFMGFFGAKRRGQNENEATRRQEEAREAPIGRLIAAGKSVVESPCPSLSTSDAIELSSSLQESEVSGNETEEKLDALQPLECVVELKTQEEWTVAEEKVGKEKKTLKCLDEKECDGLQKDAVVQGTYSADFPSSSSRSFERKELPMLVRSIPLRAALPPPRQELIQVEGDIVEL
ncbi:unnamed protein product [Peronospora belbahrii]|uniref:RanBP2-type domain-containing protein n=1 Tax=Peronospora belbahrii TaxID=622444 RepID=A0AAU9KZN7_9STRA|nr:unnamed protein product [Peronospora belbahrii]CAH0513369.1 unnamed protein product [Peronospora belbahrii]